MVCVKVTSFLDSRHVDLVVMPIRSKSHRTKTTFRQATAAWHHLTISLRIHTDLHSWPFEINILRECPLRLVSAIPVASTSRKQTVLAAYVAWKSVVNRLHDKVCKRAWPRMSRSLSQAWPNLTLMRFPLCKLAFSWADKPGTRAASQYLPMKGCLRLLLYLGYTGP